MALKSRICEMLGILYPILLAGMGVDDVDDEGRWNGGR